MEGVTGVPSHEKKTPSNNPHPSQKMVFVTTMGSRPTHSRMFLEVFPPNMGPKNTQVSRSPLSVLHLCRSLELVLAEEHEETTQGGQRKAMRLLRLQPTGKPRYNVLGMRAFDNMEAMGNIMPKLAPGGKKRE